MSIETPGWYYAEGDPAETKRYWNGVSWSEEVVGGNVLLPRFFARFIDGLVTGVLLFLIAWAASIDVDSINTLAVVSVAIVAIYEIAFITLKGATPGKMLFGFKVVEIARGQSPPSGSVAGMRFVPGLLQVIPFVGSLLYLVAVGISLFWLTRDPNRQTIFDRSGKTYVVRDVSRSRF